MISIIIPSFQHCADLLIPCIESIKKYTDLTDVEVLVVANGCTDETEYFVKQLGAPFKLIWCDKAIGFPRAVNAGIEYAKGDYIVILNNDIILLEQPKNQWLEILWKPFMGHENTVAITGPLTGHNDSANKDFVIFFCCMISKEALNKIGLLDETFGNGFFEDTDICFRAEEHGYKVLKVPETKVKYDGQNYIGAFPIWHKGHATFKELSEQARSSWYKNEKTVAERYGVNIKKAIKCDGYMANEELLWLATQAKKHEVIVEIGSWHGRSTRALGDNTPGIIYAIDHFNGSATEAMNHGSARLLDGDHAFVEFCKNNFDLIQSGKIVPLRGTGKNMCNLLKERGVKADMIFIDGGHTYEEVKEDIGTFKQILAPNGLFCGHDYSSWIGVKQAVDELIPSAKQAPNTSIWYTEKKRKVYDCFPFFNELELLDIRLHELNDVVDYFVIAEANVTHTGKPKPFNIEANKERFKEFWHKIIYIKVEDMPKIEITEGNVPGRLDLPVKTGNDAWTLERFQRDALLRGLTNCSDEDVIVTSDADEIPSKEAILNYDTKQGLKWLEQTLHYYYLNCRVAGGWNQAKIVPYKMIREGFTPCRIRYTASDSLPNGGWHFSYMGGIDRVIEKVENFSHQEYNTDVIKDRKTLVDKIENGKDLYDRPYPTFGEFIKVDSTYPKYIQDNRAKYEAMKWLKSLT